MGPMETEPAARFQALLPAEVTSRVALITEFDLRQLAAAFQLADVITSANTGPMHLAGALNQPLVALFSAHPAQGPAKWRPLGNRHTILQAPLLPGENAEIPSEQAAVHMSRIQVADVLAANLKWLSPGKRAAA
jgi:ADP-heptose:LPS heptosyltransferase